MANEPAYCIFKRMKALRATLKHRQITSICPRNRTNTWHQTIACTHTHTLKISAQQSQPKDFRYNLFHCMTYHRAPTCTNTIMRVDGSRDAKEVMRGEVWVVRNVWNIGRWSASWQRRTASCVHIYHNEKWLKPKTRRMIQVPDTRPHTHTHHTSTSYRRCDWPFATSSVCACSVWCCECVRSSFHCHEPRVLDSVE